MANLPWLDEIRQRLADQALPPNYIQRFAEELSDHLEDLKEENMGMEADAYSQLGKPEQVAEAAVTAYRRRSFVGRHTTAALLVFAISPAIAQYFLTLVGAMALMTTRGDYALTFHEDHWILSLVVLVVSIFVSILYGELAVRLGVGRRWMVVSCAVLGIMALLLQLAVGLRAITVRVPIQFAVPLTIGWWFTKRKCSPIPAATKFLVFALSPVASYSFLWCMAALAIAIAQPLLSASAESVAAHFGTTAQVAWLFAPLLLMFVVPTVVASLLYCKLAGRSGIGNRWMAVSCAVLAAFATAQSCATLARCYQKELFLLWVGLIVCVSLAQFLIPLAIGWWFVRRRCSAARLQLAQ